MRKTIFYAKISNGEITYWYGDKLLRIVTVIADIIQFALIIYLLMR